MSMAWMRMPGQTWPGAEVHPRRSRPIGNGRGWSGATPTSGTGRHGQGQGERHGQEQRERDVEMPKVASRKAWLRARKELLMKEKEWNRQRDALSAERRKLPMVRIA